MTRGEGRRAPQDEPAIPFVDGSLEPYDCLGPIAGNLEEPELGATPGDEVLGDHVHPGRQDPGDPGPTEARAEGVEQEVEPLGRGDDEVVPRADLAVGDARVETLRLDRVAAQDPGRLATTEFVS